MLSNYGLVLRFRVVASSQRSTRHLQSTVHCHGRVSAGNIFRLYFLMRRVLRDLSVYSFFRFRGGAGSLFK